MLSWDFFPSVSSQTTRCSRGKCGPVQKQHAAWRHVPSWRPVQGLWEWSSDTALDSCQESPHSHWQKYTPQSILLYINLTARFKVASLRVFLWVPLEQLCNKCGNSGASLWSLWCSWWVISGWSTCWQTGDADVNVRYMRPVFGTPAMTSVFLDLLTFQGWKWLSVHYEPHLYQKRLAACVYDLLHPKSLLLYNQMFGDTTEQGLCRSLSSGSKMISLMTCCKLCSLGDLCSCRRCLLTTGIHTERENN